MNEKWETTNGARQQAYNDNVLSVMNYEIVEFDACYIDAQLIDYYSPTTTCSPRRQGILYTHVNQSHD